MDERVDLTPLELDDIRRERMIATIMARATPELERRAAVDVSPMQAVAGWLRPALAAAAVMAMVGGSLLALTPARQPVAGVGLADELAVPQPAKEWLAEERAPTISDLLIAMEGEARQW
jgi:hypothetical protein